MTVYIPSSVKAIGPKVFEGRSSLTALTLPSGLASIGESAFKGCKLLTAVTLPDSLTAIGKEAFSSTGLRTVVVPGGVSELEYTFSSCQSLTSAVISSGVKRLAGTFSSCYNLKSAVLPEGLEAVDNNAFLFCKNLTSVTLPKTVTRIGEHAFGHCESLVSLTRAFPRGKQITAVGEGAFQGCRRLAEIPADLLSGVNRVEMHTFQNCSALKGVALPKGITHIGDYAFEGCNIRGLSLPDGLISIGMKALCGQSDSEITVPATVESIDYQAFNSFYVKKLVLLGGHPTMHRDIGVHLSNMNKYQDGFYIGTPDNPYYYLFGSSDRSFGGIHPDTKCIGYIDASYFSGGLVIPEGVEWIAGNALSILGCGSLRFSWGGCNIRIPKKFRDLRLDINEKHKVGYY